MKRSGFAPRKTALRPKSVVKKRKYKHLEDKNTQELDRVAWEWFSRYVRLRDSEWPSEDLSTNLFD